MRGGWDAGSLREATRRLQLMLRENQDSIRDRFVAALGVDKVPGARAILRLMQQWGNLRWEEMVYAVSHLHDGELDDWSKEKTVAVIGMLSRLGLLGIADGFLTIEPISVGAVVDHE